MRLKASSSSPITQQQTDGLRADILVVELYKCRKQGAGLSEAFSSFACELNHPKTFLSAIRKTLVNAFEISRSVDVTQYSWSRDGQVQHQPYQIDLDISWDKNLMNLKTANKKLVEDQVQYRLMEYQQKWLVEKEIERRTASGVTVKRAELDVLTELGESLDPPGSAAPAQSKSRLGLKNLFAIDERYLAFILTRSISDSKWTRILRGEYAGVDTAMILKWIDLASLVCDQIWNIQTVLKNKGPNWHGKLAELFISKDIAAGVAFSNRDRSAWRFASSEWAHINQMIGFAHGFKEKAYPGVSKKGPLCGPMYGAGSMESLGYAGDLYKLRNWALTTRDLDGNGAPSLVPLVDLKEGDYLGTVPGILRASTIDGHKHGQTLFIQGPSSICLEPVPSPLWVMLSSLQRQPGNVVVCWQPITDRSGWRDMPCYEFLAFAARPIKALEPLILDECCLVSSGDASGSLVSEGKGLLSDRGDVAMVVKQEAMDLEDDECPNPHEEAARIPLRTIEESRFYAFRNLAYATKAEDLMELLNKVYHRATEDTHEQSDMVAVRMTDTEYSIFEEYMATHQVEIETAMADVDVYDEDEEIEAFWENRGSKLSEEDAVKLDWKHIRELRHLFSHSLRARFQQHSHTTKQTLKGISVKQIVDEPQGRTSKTQPKVEDGDSSNSKLSQFLSQYRH
jgi:hypothetical protein